MHIPDNYLSPATCIAMGSAMVPVWAVAARQVSRGLTRERIPLLGIGAAFSFLIMMFNIPLPGGTTGHAVGATLVAALLGPWAAAIAISVALFLQAILFGDGGILAFGANAFNMAFAMPFLGYAVYRCFRRLVKGAAGETLGLAAGAYLSLNFGALCAAIEFGLQPLLFRDAAGLPMYCPFPLSVSLPAMLIPHLAVAGPVEAAFTVAVAGFVRRVAPEATYEGSSPLSKPVFALLLALVLLAPLGLLASGTAWGEWGKDEIAAMASGGKAPGFLPSGMARGPAFEAPIPDYAMRGMPDGLGYILSAAAGCAVLVIAFKLVGLAMRGRTAGKRGES